MGRAEDAIPLELAVHKPGEAAGQSPEPSPGAQSQQWPLQPWGTSHPQEKPHSLPAGAAAGLGSQSPRFLRHKE